MFGFAQEDEISSITREFSSWSAEHQDSNPGNNIRCHTFAMNGGVCIRTNTVPFYMEANRQVSISFSYTVCKAQLHYEEVFNTF